MEFKGEKLKRCGQKMGQNAIWCGRTTKMYLLREKQFEKILLKYGWEKVSNWECLFVHREKELFLFVYVDDIKKAGKNQNIDPMWRVRNKEVDLGKPTSFLDHVNLGCTQKTM